MSPATFDAVVRRLQNSRNPLEREHILLGFHAEYGYPILLHKKLLREHLWALGGSGSGKSTRIEGPLESQLIRGDSGGVIIFDLKGERNREENARREALRTRRTFKQFTNELGLPSYVFNPI